MCLRAAWLCNVSWSFLDSHLINWYFPNSHSNKPFYFCVSREKLFPARHGFFVNCKLSLAMIEIRVWVSETTSFYRPICNTKMSKSKEFHFTSVYFVSKLCNALVQGQCTGRIQFKALTTLHSNLRVSRTKNENLSWQVGKDINLWAFGKIVTS